MKAATIHKLTVKCDKCDFKKDVPMEKVKEYHNATCPKCENILIDDKDMAHLDALVLSVDLINKLVGDVKEQSTVSVSIDSAALK